MVLHTLDIILHVGGLLYSRGVDIPIGENAGRHSELICKFRCVADVCLNCDERNLVSVEELFFQRSARRWSSKRSLAT
jgi:hypothetical protein